MSEDLQSIECIEIENNFLKVVHISRRKKINKLRVGYICFKQRKSSFKLKP